MQMASVSVWVWLCVAKNDYKTINTINWKRNWEKKNHQINHVPPGTTETWSNTFSICNAIDWITGFGSSAAVMDHLYTIWHHLIGWAVTKDSPIDWNCSKTEWKVQGNRHLSLIFACVPCTSSMHDDTVHRHNNNKLLAASPIHPLSRSSHWSSSSLSNSILS